MRTLLKMLLATGLLGSAMLTTALAEGGWYPPVKDKVVKEECGACHMPFSPAFLPTRSWEKIMSTLPDHFGEDASLDADTARHIRDYLVQNAADTRRYNRMLRGVKKTDVPLRITELPRWKRAHAYEVSARAWKRAGSKANCQACHRGAEKGYYGDD